MKKINYLEILKKSWRITWTHKNLWWFGLIIGTGSGLNISFPGNSQEKIDDSEITEQIYSFFATHTSLIIGMILFLILFFLVFGVLKILAYSSLIKAVQKIEPEEKISFWHRISLSKIFFWRVLGIKTIFICLSLGLFLVLALPNVFLFFTKSYIMGTVSTLLAIAIFIPAIITFSFIEKFGNLYVITSALSLRSALEQGYSIFINNVGPSLIMLLLFIPINILLGIFILTILFLISLPFIILATIFYQLTFLIITWLIGILGLVLILAFALAIRSLWGVFFSTTWLLFFEEIATAKKEGAGITQDVVITEEIQPEKAC